MPLDDPAVAEGDPLVGARRPLPATVLVVHTFTATTPGSALIRIISARAATNKERQQYEGP